MGRLSQIATMNTDWRLVIPCMAVPTDTWVNQPTIGSHATEGVSEV